MHRGRRAAVIVGLVLWALCSAAWAGYLMLERGLASDTSCPIAESSSNYGKASWRWAPPGVRCTWRGVSYHGTEYELVRDPPLGRAVFGVVLLTWGATLGAVAWTSRPPRSERTDPWTGFDRGRVAR